MSDTRYNVSSLTLELILNPESISYKIPVFQRNYAWTNDEVNQLVDDLFGDINWQDESQQETEPYFLGSIVLTNNDEASLVLDGQQRLTTISLLLAVLRDKLSQAGYNDSNDIQKYLITGKIGRGRKKSKIELQPVDKEVYDKLIADTSAYTEKSIKRTRLAISIKTISSRIDHYVSQVMGQNPNISQTNILLMMLGKLLYDVEVVKITTPSESEAFRLFETLNDRGLALNAADLVKNKLFSRCKKEDLDDTIKAWSEMVQYVGENEVVNFLRYYWIASYGMVRRNKVFDKYATKLRGLNSVECGVFAIYLQEAAKIYQELSNPYGSDVRWDSEVVDTLSRLLKYRARICRPALLACALKHEEKLADVARACETISVRYSIVAEKNSNVLEKFYADLAGFLRDPQSNVEEFLTGRREIFRDVPNDSEFNKLFRESEIPTASVPSTWRQVLEFINTYQGTGETTVQGASKVHVEHILPRKSTSLVLKESGLSIEEYEEYKFKIGNLTLLSGTKNRQISNKPFSQKRQAFEESEIGLNKWVSEQEAWSRNEIDSRCELLSNLAVEAYPWPISKKE